MLQHGHGALVVVAAQQHLAEQREAEAVRAVDLDDPEQLSLRLFPLVQRRVGARQADPAFEVVGRALEAGIADGDRVLGPTQVEVGIREIDERGRGWIPPDEIDQLLDFLGRWTAIGSHEAA